MEKELNIAAILKDKPKGTKLYSTPFGDCTFDNVANDDNIRFTERGDAFYTDGYGKYSPNGECLVFPSKQMRDWSKFAWKKGDVLTDGWGSYSIFIEFDQGTGYANVVLDFLCDLGNAKINHDIGQISYPISDWRKASNEKAKEVISHIEKFFGGKLNLETLEIEKQPKQEFKDGDIVHIPAGDITDEAIFIAKVEAKGVLHSYVYMSKDSMIPLAKSLFSVSGYLDSLRLATNLEKQQLFSALEKEGKRWNPNTKSIEDLPKKCEFKPMDWCLMKDSTKYWELCQFAYTRKVHGTTIYSAVGGLIYYKCIPYNDQTKHLLGTTDDWEGGNDGQK